MNKIQYTGTNFEDVQAFTEGRVLAPYEGMGFSMLSILSDDGLLTVNEGDWVCRDAEGRLFVSYDGSEV